MARGQGTVVVRIIGEVRDVLGKLKLTETGIGQFASSSRNLIRKSFDDITRTITSRFGAMGAEAQKAFDKIGNSATSSGNAVALGVGAGAAVAGAAFVDLGIKGIKAFVDLATQVRSFARLSGESAETSSRWVAVTKVLGVEQETVARGLFMLNKQIAANSDGFKKNGIEVARNADGSVDLLQTLLNVSDAYKRVGGGSAGATIAQEAFGRSGLKMLPILAAGRDRIEEFWNAAADHGEILSDADLEKARKFQVSLRELTAAAHGLEIATGEGLVPALTNTAKAATAVVDIINKATKPIGGLAGVIRGLVENTVNPLKAVQDMAHGSKDAGDAAASAADDIGAMSDELDNSTDAFSAGEQAADSYSKALQRLDDDLFGVADAQDAVNRDFEDLQQQADDFAERRATAAKRMADAQEQGARRVRDAEEELADARKKLNDLSGGSENAAEYMRRYLTGQSGMTDEIANATKRVHDAEQNVTDARKDSADAIADSKKQLDDLTRKEGDARRAAEQQRDTIRKIPADIKTVVAEMEKEGKPASEIVAYLEAQRQKLADSGVILGANKQLITDTLEELKQYQAFVLFTQGVAAGERTVRQRAADTVEKSKDIASKIAPSSVVMNVYGAGDDPELIATIAAQKIGWALNGA